MMTKDSIIQGIFEGYIESGNRSRLLPKSQFTSKTFVFLKELINEEYLELEEDKTPNIMRVKITDKGINYVKGLYTLKKMSNEELIAVYKQTRDRLGQFKRFKKIGVFGFTGNFDEERKKEQKYLKEIESRNLDVR